MYFSRCQGFCLIPLAPRGGTPCMGAFYPVFGEVLSRDGGVAQRRQAAKEASRGEVYCSPRRDEVARWVFVCFLFVVHLIFVVQSLMNKRDAPAWRLPSEQSPCLFKSRITTQESVGSALHSFLTLWPTQLLLLQIRFNQLHASFRSGRSCGTILSTSSAGFNQLRVSFNSDESKNRRSGCCPGFQSAPRFIQF